MHSSGLPLLWMAYLLVISSSVFAQGPLVPPGPPAPSMQTLDQLGAKADQANVKLDRVNAKADALEARSEKRTPVDAANTPGDAENEFIIAGPGSYYLTANLSVAKPTGIRILAAGVTLDLNGFQVARSGSASGAGIQVQGAACTIRNGSITGFSSAGSAGVSATSAAGGALLQVVASSCRIGLETGDGWLVDRCNARENTETGVKVGAGSTVSRCNALNNGGSGIATGSGSTVLGCSAVGNRGLAGIEGGSTATVADCTARANTSALDVSAGISVGAASLVSGCNSTSNSSTHPTPVGTRGAGILASAWTKVYNCNTSFNKGDGIRGSQSSIILENVCARNGQAGIQMTDVSSRIEGNNVTSNDRGIDVLSGSNLIIRNSARGNAGAGVPSANYDIGAGNFVGTIVTTEAAMNSAANSNINISF